MYATSYRVRYNEHFPVEWQVQSFLCRVWVRADTSAVRAFYHMGAWRRICASFKWIIIGLTNGLSSSRHQATWTRTVPSGIQFSFQENAFENVVCTMTFAPDPMRPKEFYIYLMCYSYASQTPTNIVWHRIRIMWSYGMDKLLKLIMNKVSEREKLLPCESHMQILEMSPTHGKI